MFNKHKQRILDVLREHGECNGREIRDWLESDRTGRWGAFLRIVWSPPVYVVLNELVEEKRVTYRQTEPVPERGNIPLTYWKLVE